MLSVSDGPGMNLDLSVADELQERSGATLEVESQY